MQCLKLLSALFSINIVNGFMEGNILGGKTTKIKNYPHSINFDIYCAVTFKCGGSILNQLVMLTASHCLEDCKGKHSGTRAYIMYGHEHIDRMKSIPVRHYVMHKRYSEQTMANDIALVIGKFPIRLDQHARRVALLRSSPSNLRLAYVAGWGVTNYNHGGSDVLLEGTQEIQPVQVCQKVLGPMNPGSFCADPFKGVGRPGVGDSGSALVIKEFIQIGLVSYRVIDKKSQIVVYTNVSYYYDWIMLNSAKIACAD